MTPPRSSARCGRAFPQLATPRREDICYATQNRQDAVKKLLEQCDVLLVVGSRTSSNSNRLRELADRAGVPGYLIDGPEDLKPEWFAGRAAVGVTAGASAPELLVQQVVAAAQGLGRRGAGGGERARGARVLHAAAGPAPQLRRTRVARRSTAAGSASAAAGCRRRGARRRASARTGSASTRRRSSSASADRSIRRGPGRSTRS